MINYDFECVISFLIILIGFSYLPGQPPEIDWTRRYGGSGQSTFDNGYCIQHALDGGYIIVGRSNSYGAGMQNCYIIKIDAYGDTLWTRVYGGNDADISYFVQLTQDSCYIITGYTHSSGAGESDVYLLKINANGDSLWSQTFGGSMWEEGFEVQQTSDGGFIIAAQTNSFGVGNRDVYLIKTDENGNEVWAKTFGWSNDDAAYSVKQTSDGGYIVAGAVEYGTNQNVYIIKTDADGDTLWTKVYGGTNSDAAYFLEAAPGGGYVVVGCTRSYGMGNYDVYLLRLDDSGDTLWTKTYGSYWNDIGREIQPTFDNGYIITGYTDSYSTVYDIYLVRINSDGDTLWTNHYDGFVNQDMAYSVKQTPDSGFIMVGETWLSGMDSDIYVIKLKAEVGIEETGCRLHLPSVRIWPNPFKNSVNIEFAALVPDHLSLNIFDYTGRLVKRLDGVNNKSPRRLSWDGKNENGKIVPSGVYFLRIKANGLHNTKKLVIMN